MCALTPALWWWAVQTYAACSAPQASQMQRQCASFHMLGTALHEGLAPQPVQVSECKGRLPQLCGHLAMGGLLDACIERTSHTLAAPMACSTRLLDLHTLSHNPWLVTVQWPQPRSTLLGVGRSARAPVAAQTALSMERTITQAVGHAETEVMDVRQVVHCHVMPCCTAAMLLQRGAADLM